MQAHHTTSMAGTRAGQESASSPTRAPQTRARPVTLHGDNAMKTRKKAHRAASLNGANEYITFAYHGSSRTLYGWGAIHSPLWAHVLGHRPNNAMFGAYGEVFDVQNHALGEDLRKAMPNDPILGKGGLCDRL